jgi:lipopolysaccharide export system permease protein
MNKNNELVSLFSMGMSLARVSTPILAMCGLFSLGSFWLGDRILPQLNQKRNYIYYVELKKRPWLYQTVKRNRIWYRSDNIIFNIQTLDADQGKAQGLTMYYFDEAWKLIQQIKARDVMLNDREWELQNGTVTLFAEESSFPLTRSFEKKLLHMSEDLADIRSAPSTSEIMTLKELGRFIKKNTEMGLDTVRFETDYYAKLAFAMAGFVLAMVGIPFTTRRQRAGGTMVSIAVATGLAAAYWMAFGASVSLGYHGVLPPFLAAWGPNMLMLGGSSFLLLRSPV